jgi:hypothetical protein
MLVQLAAVFTRRAHIVRGRCLFVRRPLYVVIRDHLMVMLEVVYIHELVYVAMVHLSVFLFLFWAVVVQVWVVLLTLHHVALFCILNQVRVIAFPYILSAQRLAANRDQAFSNDDLFARTVLYFNPIAALPIDALYSEICISDTGVSD